MTNILKAIYNIIHQAERTINKEGHFQHNRMNEMGGALEKYMKEAFSGTFQIANEQEQNRIYSENFSWLGNQNNPPDFMIKEGDAIEVKKIESLNADLALNSSYPKSKLSSGNPMIAKKCQTCEMWDIKDIIYSIGCVNKTKLRSLWLVYGSIYAAESNIYENMRNRVSVGINSISDIEFEETKELGRVNQVDPLGITNLRIRGMWSIQNPRKVFEYIQPQQNDVTFELVSIIPNDKYNSFDDESRFLLEGVTKEGFSILDVQVKDPNNPATLIGAKLIKYII
jgi:hypothetical protein